MPLLLAVPVAGLLLNIAPQDLPGLMLALLAGTPALVLLGGIGASLAVSVRRGGLLTGWTLPFYVPVLIFGAGATEAALEAAVMRLVIVAFISLAALFLAPLAIGVGIKGGNTMKQGMKRDSMTLAEL